MAPGTGWPAAAALLLAILGLAHSSSESSAVSCEARQFRCADGLRCVPAAWRCDGRAHCADGSDELHCSSPNPSSAACRGDEFRCAVSNFCLAPSWRCDGEPDCGAHDASDEDPYMCQKDFKCPGNSARCETPVDGQFTCVPIQHFCDGERHCPDASDEWDICDNFTAAQCAALQCEVGCRPTHAGPACYCGAGYEAGAGGRCHDTDECARDDACAQLCRNTVGSYACSCAAGYRLHDDGRDCVPINEPEGEPLSLVLVTAGDVRRVWPGDEAREAPQWPRTRTRLPALNVRAIDILYSNRSVCYVHHNLSAADIVCADADDLARRRVLPRPALFPDVAGVSHLAADWVAGNWYLVDGAREALYACTRDLRHCRLLVEGALGKVHGFALDPAAGLMFWTVWGAAPPAVERASLAGAERAPVAALKLVYPSALTLEPAARTLYWADAYLDCVERADYSGAHRRTLRRGYASQELLHIAALGGVLYLPSWRNSSLLLAARGRARSLPLDARPTAALAFHRARQPRSAHPCAARNGGCAHLCITAYDGGAARAHCLCRHGWRLAGRGACERAHEDAYLVLARGAPPLVQALALRPRGWEAAAPATDAARPTAADVDTRDQYLYYCDVHRYEIVRQRLDGSGREVFAGRDVDNCEGLAVDWMGERGPAPSYSYKHGRRLLFLRIDLINI
ncbi:unnamed protein product [Spodoptera littoralis]|uniref:EGF-like domain-containing protein n=1 Tax=Spodoptera littoralis TaxID=7109 RepID=A0A9P0I6X8_SPOLI|nr:unnamed protein product [Spodoptera littoralis]